MNSIHSNAIERGALTLALMEPITKLLELPGVTEVCINRPGEAYVEQGADWVKHSMPMLSFDYLLSIAQAVATYSEQAIGQQKPILSAMLPGGERIQIVVPPAVEQDTVSFTIRKPGQANKPLDDYIRDGAFDRYIWARPAKLDERWQDLSPVEQALAKALDTNRLADFLTLAVKERKNIAVVGDTGSGKTTLMKSICQSIPTHERIVTIEDVRELFIPNHPNRVHLLYSKSGQGVAKVTPADLIASNMRMKPDRVLLAELRGGEAFDFLKLLTTGHSGSITSYHAESCALAAERYVFMCREHEQAATYDTEALKNLVSLTIDVIIHVVAKVVSDENGSRKSRYVEEIHYDPIAKLRSRFGDASIHHAQRT
jgi:type IV secretion system protein VirB11